MSTQNTESDKKRYGKTFRVFMGAVFVILGIIGSFLPVLQGWLFFLIAFVLLFPEHPKVVKLIAKVEKKHPKWVRWLHAFGIGNESEEETDTRETECQ